MKKLGQKVLTLDELEATWGASVLRVPRSVFALSDVPENLLLLVPYALLWGASDDWTREDVLKGTPELLQRNLKRVVSAFDDSLDDWLAGPEASSSEPSDAYVAFSAMRMSADFVADM